ncbi:TPA: hypothetical protein F6U38_11750 [Escherichia coli]|nr:hypothetical protein [Escherichia coli]
MNIETVNGLIASLESAGELSIREQKFLKLAKAHVQLAAENVALKAAIPDELFIDVMDENIDDISLAEDIGFNACVRRIARTIQETPATDRIVAAQRSAFVDEAVSKITESGALTIGDCIVALCQLREGASE